MSPLLLNPMCLLSRLGRQDLQPRSCRELALVWSSFSVITNMASSKHSTELAQANNGFAVKLYGTVRNEQKGKNLFFSPLSISTALAMTYLGASGNTAKQIADVFGFSQVGNDQVHKAFLDLNQLLNTPNPGYQLRSANKLYGKSDFKFVQSFTEGTGKYYGSSIHPVEDFAPPEIRKTINDWVSEQTAGKIQDLIPAGILDSLTRLVLINAIYFKGNWASKFSESKTSKDIFKVTDDRKTVKGDFMRQFGKFPLVQDSTNDCLVLELPYQGKNLSMLIALPTKDDGLPELESKLCGEILETWDSQLVREKKVNIVLPKFKLEATLQLKETLTHMGMPDAFDEGFADFAGISGNRDLFVSAVIHKAFVDVNEEGTEAAAATAVLMRLRGGAPPPEIPILFQADHPFLFLIRHRPSNSILFMGRVLDPS